MSIARRYAAVALLLAASLAVARLLEERAASALRADVESARRAATEAVLEDAARRLDDLQADLLRRAEVLAAHPRLRAALRDSAAADEALDVFRRLRLPDGVAAELYTPMPRLLAWRGPALPPDPATRRTSFLSVPQTAALADGPYREAIVAWVPVREDGEVIGAVRVARLVRVRVPVRNQYLRDEDLFERWTRARPPALRAVPSEVRLGAPAEGGLAVRTVAAVDGPPLAHVVAALPPGARLEEAARAPWRDAQVFFAMLLLGWGLWGLGLLAERAVRRAARTRRGRGHLGAAALGVLVAAAWAASRYALLELDVPARWAGTGSAAPAVLDPAHLGSGFGGGIAGSVADLALTGAWALGGGIAALHAGLVLLRARKARARLERETPPRLSAGWLLGAAAGTVVGVGALGAAAALVHRASVDATLPYFGAAGLAPGGLLPDALVLLAFGAFLVTMLAAGLLMTGIAAALGLRGRPRFVAAGILWIGALAGAYAVLPLGDVLPWPVALAVGGVAAVAALVLEREPAAWARVLTLRGALGVALLAALVAYPVVFGALHAREEARVRDAAEDFAVGEDARVAFALESVLLDARASEAVGAALAWSGPLPPGRADSLAADLVSGSLLAALADYHVSLTLHARDGSVLGQYIDAPTAGADRVAQRRLERDSRDPGAFRRLRLHYEEEAGLAGFAVVREPVGGRGGRYRYAGVGPVRAEIPRGRILGWITARAEPKPARYVAETPFPRVLVPAGLYRHDEDAWAFAQFTDGVLLRARGGDFGRFRLPPAVEALPPGQALWRRETAEGAPVRVYYWRATGRSTIAVRVPAPTPFDHLYHLLRLLLPGLVLAIAAHGAGRLVQRLGGPAPARPRLRDRVLHRFLLVGLLAVGTTGAIGWTVIVTQNREAVHERLKQRLARVEQALVDEALELGLDPATLPPDVLLERVRPDLVASRLGLDLNVYRDGELVATSRSQLVRQRLIEPRLPVEVAHALLVEGRRYAFATERIGAFRYTTGFEALPDAEGRPAAVLAVPTLPEQIAIEADQARMVAYLFGVLLLLFGVVYAVASVLASRLTRPFRRLRDGLRAVGAGDAPPEPIPVETRDEIGEVIETFNAVWDQLEESRRRLAAQERELAWREMAQQVAHEIKNPLTPMKLSVQHLRRAYERAGGAGGNGDPRFGPLLDRITGTLVEQIDALGRIAGEFSRFARLPDPALERIDLVQVLRQAAALVAEEPRARLVLALPETPLPVMADREELRRVFINLLRNAQQAIPEGERGTVTVRAERRDEDGRAWAVGSVADTGTGIPPDVQPRIFQPRFSTKTSGMGLGLAIARKAVEDLGGTITFTTEPGVGTTFFVRLPLAEEDGASA